ncbi:MAG: 6-phosphogluconolactonase, partial [Saprospiraceae bacterium]
GPKAADWKLLGSFADIINPSFVCLSNTHPIIYAVSEQGPDVAAPKSVIKVIQYDPESFEMTVLQTVSAIGDAPCYISTDKEGRFLFVANYVSGNVVQYAIEKEGRLQPGISAQHLGKGPHSRQEGPHAHYIRQHPTAELVYAIDLGIDQIIRYRPGNKGLEAMDTVHTETGSGPRHMVWHPNGTSAYILNELTGSIEHWIWNDSLSQRNQIVSLKPDFSEAFAGSADIHIDKSAQFVYASLRGDFNEIVVLRVDPDTHDLSLIQRVAVGGEVPRNFAISPGEDYLAVALQDSDKITLFSRDADTGLLSEVPEVVEVKTPVCVVYQEF